MTDQIQLNSSKLGTKEYWNDFYRREQRNFQDNEEDTGECWFDDSDAESKMIEFIINHINEGTLPAGLNHKSQLSFVDLGTGNGHLLFQMHEDFEQDIENPEISFKFHGIDYSPDSVAFAKDIAAKKYADASLDKANFQFDQVDLLSANADFLDSHKFDFVLDKGTLDAIALNQDPIAALDGKRGMDVYASQVARMMHPDSVFLITSCNFTESELVMLITSSTDLRVWSKVEYPNFSFGGQKGSTVVSIAFVKK
ncbi:uncharacterized protein LODBEIA_P24800 [Lodderomyces beijingensis]|uniref:Protein-lysine N-methyltransferase EFM4 n=1 Tax=Lodderomyces beijingensis TaxID=1775926 RepID=A0ABP0ZMB7_9ASCO